MRGINYGVAVGAAGAQNFFGEGYPFHRVYRLMFPGFFSWKGMGLTGKTATLLRNMGYMPLEDDGCTPMEMRPECIRVNFWKASALNAVGLSNFGYAWYLNKGIWQKRTDAFGLSFMAIEKTPSKRCAETEGFVTLLKEYLRDFLGNPYLQINKSCPNVKHMSGISDRCFIDETLEELEILRDLPIPVAVKFSVLTHTDTVGEIAQHPACDAVCISNTVPWGALPEKIDWKGLFGSSESPLKKFGGGGLSGKPLLPLLIDWLTAAEGKIEKPIIAGGGIMSAHDVKMVARKRPAAISLGTIAMLRPWNLQSAIRAAHRYIYDPANDVRHTKGDPLKACL